MTARYSVKVFDHFWWWIKADYDVILIWCAKWETKHIFFRKRHFCNEAHQKGSPLWPQIFRCCALYKILQKKFQINSSINSVTVYVNPCSFFFLNTPRYHITTYNSSSNRRYNTNKKTYDHLTSYTQYYNCILILLL